MTTATRDEILLGEDCDHAIELGFGGKLLIHPAQLAPSDAEREWANKVLAAASADRGAFQLDGEMIDTPVIARAHQIVARAAP